MPEGTEVGSIYINVNMDSDEYDKGLQQMQNSTNGLLDWTKLKWAAISAAVVKAISTMTASFGRYEQLIGGVETLFKESSDTVIQYANEAYRSAGMSANEYMETVTGVSASLLQSLGGDTAKAAEAANQALIDMSDNANKMGTDIESIKNAYAGFAKQNYTMLDNLKIGYGGTKTEMERLLKDAEALSGVKYDINNLSDVYDAIHVIQTELGITGTTAAEAASTLEGSAASMKASFENMLTAIAGGGNVKDTMRAFFESAATYAGRLIPTITTILKNVPAALKAFVQAIPDVLQSVMPEIVDGISGFIIGIVEIIPDVLITTFNGIFPIIAESFLQLMEALGTGLLEALPLIIAKLPSIITAIINYFLGTIPQIIQTGINLLTALVDDLPSIITAITNAIPNIIIAILSAVLNNIPAIIDAGFQLFTALVGALPEIIIELVKAIGTLWENMKQKLEDFRPRMKEKGKEIFDSLINGIGSTYLALQAKVDELMHRAVKAITDKVSDWADAGRQLVNGIWEGIKGGWDWLINSVKNLANNLVAKVKGTLGIHSPSTVFADIGENLAKGLDVGYTVEWDDFEKHTLNSFKGMVNGLNNIDMMQGATAQRLTADALEPVITQIVLDGKVIAESTNRYNRNLALSVGR